MIPSLNSILIQYAEAFNLGRATIYGHSISLFSILVTLEISISGIYIALRATDAYVQLAKKILLTGFILFVVKNYDILMQQVIEGFIQVGEEAARVNGPSIASLNNPDRIVSRAFEIIKPGMVQLATSTHESFMGRPTVDSIVTMICLFIGMIALFLIAIQAFVTYLEFLLISSLAVVLIPFGVFKPTAFLAEKTFGAIVGFGIKLMVLALILGVTDTILADIEFPETITWQSGFHFILVSLSLCFLSLHAPSVALGLLHGQPSLSGGTLAASGVAGAAVGAATGRGVWGVAKAATATAAHSVGAGMQGASTLRSNYMSKAGSVGGESGLVSKAARATSSTAMGVMGAVGGAVSGGLSWVGKATVSRLDDHLKSNFSRGKQAVPEFQGFRPKKTDPPSSTESATGEKANTITKGESQEK